jgi:Fe-S-cluster containining protein
MSCGACCASFRVSFYWAEAEANGLPENLTERLNDRFSCMAGTNSEAPRCAALQGTVGESAVCTAYAQRPSPCREVQPGDVQCLKARAKHGLPAL